MELCQSLIWPAIWVCTYTWRLLKFHCPFSSILITIWDRYLFQNCRYYHITFVCLGFANLCASLRASIYLLRARARNIPPRCIRRTAISQCLSPSTLATYSESSFSSCFAHVFRQHQSFAVDDRSSLHSPLRPFRVTLLAYLSEQKFGY